MNIPEKPLYLAGPMSGIPQFNFPAFIEAAAVLRDVGMKIISPAELDDPDTVAAAMASPDGKAAHTNGQTWGDFLARDVRLIANECGGIVLLPDWHLSRGARLEAYVGLLCDHPMFIYIPSWEEFKMCQVSQWHVARMCALL